jgi:hypothetical protein
MHHPWNIQASPAYDRHMIELRYALRSLFNNRALAINAILCLAIGIGANTAIYTVPALRATYMSPASAMRAGGRTMSAGPERFTGVQGRKRGRVAAAKRGFQSRFRYLPGLGFVVQV